MIAHPKPKHKKRKRVHGVDNKYREWLKTQPCANPNCREYVEVCIPAHQRILGNGGTAFKPPDRDALPLCYWCHSGEHSGSVTFWGKGTKAKTKIYVQTLCYEHIERYLQ